MLLQHVCFYETRIYGPCNVASTRSRIQMLHAHVFHSSRCGLSLHAYEFPCASYRKLLYANVFLINAHVFLMSASTSYIEFPTPCFFKYSVHLIHITPLYTCIFYACMHLIHKTSLRTCIFDKCIHLIHKIPYASYFL